MQEINFDAEKNVSLISIRSLLPAQDRSPQDFITSPYSSQINFNNNLKNSAGPASQQQQQQPIQNQLTLKKPPKECSQKNNTKTTNNRIVEESTPSTTFQKQDSIKELSDPVELDVSTESSELKDHKIGFTLDKSRKVLIFDRQRDILDTLEDPTQKKLTINKYKHPNLEFLFQPVKDFETISNKKKPYFLDGDPEMYTDENIKKRLEIKEEVQVKESIDSFLEIFKFDKNDCVSMNEYMKVFLKLSIILRPDLQTEEQYYELKYTLERDWERDSKGDEKIHKYDLIDAIYELTDIWTTSTDKNEYVSFLEILKFKYIFENVGENKFLSIEDFNQQELKNRTHK